MNYESVIGLEVHVQLATKSKLFCACATEFGSEPNQNTCPVCLGWPGSLPVLNREALRLAVKVGIALDCEIAERWKFDRKNYFYPDLPKAYQISQYDQPVNRKGYLEVEMRACHSRARGNPEAGSPLKARGDDSEPPRGDDQEKMVHKRIGITRAHLEEDAGKLLHEGIKEGSLVDYNRAGIPLLEIVSEPDLGSSEEAHAYLTSLKALLQYLEVSDCDMEKGQLRCDANVSLRKKGESKLGTKVEIKNMNSFRAVQKALEFEIARQGECLASGERIVQETRLWNEAKGETFSMRSKEEAHDYRYFPEPDLVPFTISRDEVQKIRQTLPELPATREKRFVTAYGLSAYDASVLVQEKRLADFFEAVCKPGDVEGRSSGGMELKKFKTAASWVLNDFMGELNARKLTLEASPIGPSEVRGLIQLIEQNLISGKIAKEVLPLMFESRKSAEAIVKEKGLVQVTDTKQIEEIVERVVAAHPKSVSDFRAGRRQALGFLVGQVMKESGGRANPKLVNEILEKKLSRRL